MTDTAQTDRYIALLNAEIVDNALLREENERLRALLVRHDECATIDEACGQDTKWTKRFHNLVAETRATLTTRLGGKE